MANDFDRILDECIDRITRGETIEACLSDYPERAKQLEPLLQATVQTKASYSFTPSADNKRAARQRFYAALERTRRPSLLNRVLAHRLVWATLASVLVILAIGYVALRATIFPTEPPSITIPGPNADGNFAFLVSDEVNAIGDFSNLYVTIDKVGLLKSGDSELWVEFSPEVKEFDLTLLPGEKTQELWRGNVPEGDYSKVIVYVSGLQGTLKATGEIIEIKLPSNKLQMSKPFQVTTGNITSFTYDLTVVKAGNAQSGGKYLLKPQVDQSGASQQPDQVKSKSKERPSK
jgi:hypothetical protein